VTARRYVFLFFVLAAAALVAESTDVTARPLASAPVRSTVTLDYNLQSGRVTGQVKSALAKCKSNRRITVKANTGRVVATTRTNRRGYYTARSPYQASLPGEIDYVALIKLDRLHGTRPNTPIVCAPARSRPDALFDDLGCRGISSQSSQYPDEDSFAVGCSTPISKVGEVAAGPITRFQNPAFAVAPPGAQGTRQIPGAQMDSAWVEYTPSPPLEPRWVLFNNLAGLPNGTRVLIFVFTTDGRAQQLPLITQ
jgi:hypothetical protein